MMSEITLSPAWQRVMSDPRKAAAWQRVEAAIGTSSIDNVRSAVATFQALYPGPDEPRADDPTLGPHSTKGDTHLPRLLDEEDIEFYNRMEQIAAQKGWPSTSWLP